jgi:hypothetical protein
MEVFFHKVRDGKYIPRAVLVDLEPGVIARIEGGDMAKLFDEEQHRPQNPRRRQQLGAWLQCRRRARHRPDHERHRRRRRKDQVPQGFLLTHSIGGGSGSGLGSLILERLRQAYPKKKIFTFSVAPSPVISDSAVEPYNAILTLQRILDNADAAVMLDNEALFRIAKAKLNRSPNYMDLNHIIALIMSSVTASLRFPGKLNTDLSEFVTNLVPFPGNHFLTASFAPMRGPGRKVRCASISPTSPAKPSLRTTSPPPSTGQTVSISPLAPLPWRCEGQGSRGKHGRHPQDASISPVTCPPA